MDFLKDAQIIDNLEIEIPRRPLVTSVANRFLSFGSCFAQNLQTHIGRYGFPFFYERDLCGHYSSGSISDAINRLVKRSPINDEDLFCFENTPDTTVSAYQYMLKRNYHGTNAKERLLDHLNHINKVGRQELETCDFLVLTLGTSRIIRLNRNDRIINAAAGIGHEHWRSEMLSVEENVAYLEKIVSDLSALRNGSLPKIIITLSPQRYLFSQDVPGLEDISPFIDNSVSKSILRVAVDEFARKHSNKPIHYFPSYEIVMDELRLHETISTYDYCHIEQSLTPKYVVKRFLSSYCSDDLIRYFEASEQANGIYNSITADLDLGMQPEDPRISSRLDQLDSIKESLSDESRIAAFSNIDIDLLQRSNRHQEVLSLFEGKDGANYDLRSRWKVTQSYLACDQSETAKSLLQEVERDASRNPSAFPNVFRDTRHSLALIEGQTKR